MKKIFLLLFCLQTLLSSAYGARLIIELKKTPTTSDLNLLKNISGVSSVKRFYKFNNDYFLRLYEVEINQNQIEKLKTHKLINKVEKVHEINSPEQSIIPRNDLPGITNDSFVGYQWGIHNNGQKVIRDIDDIHSDEIEAKRNFDIDITELRSSMNDLMKKEILVAVLDSGLSLDHPDLISSIYKNMSECDESGSLRYKPKDDRDNNGLKGDCMGWNFTAKDEGNHRPYDDKGHGTHVAGIIGAKVSNSLGTAGIGGKIKILPIKVIKKVEQLKGAGLVSFTDRIAKGILYAITMDVKIINLSLGWPRAIDTEYLRQAVKAAIDQDIQIVSAAGNNNTNIPIFPCAYNNVVCVGAAAADGTVAQFSNFGGMVDLLAPGEKILSTYPVLMTPNFFSTEGYEVKNGTSQAAPFVAGALAVLHGVYPNSTNDEIIGRLFATALKVDSKKNFLSGMIQVNKAVNVEPTPVIIPSFKEFDVVTFNMKDKKFKVEIPLKNYWKDAKNVLITLKVENEGIENVEIISTYENHKMGEVKQIFAEGNVIDPNKDASTRLSLTILVDGEEKTFIHDVQMVRMIGDDLDVIRKDIQYSGPIKDILLIKNGQILPRIFTVTDKYKSFFGPEYFFPTKDEKKLNLNILKMKGESFVVKTRYIQNCSKILNVFKIDLNYDGKPDYLIRSIAAIDDKKFLMYSYLNSSLEDLFSGSHFSYTPEMKVFLNMKQASMIPVIYNGVKIAIPFWAASGKIPLASKNPDPFSDEDLSVNRHLYYLKPTMNNGEADYKKMELRIFDDYIFRENITSDLDISWEETINIMGLLFQGEKKQITGKAHLQMSIGEAFLRKYYKVDIGLDLKFKYQEMDFNGISLEGNFKVPVTNITDKKSLYLEGTAFSGLQSDTLAQYLVLNFQDQKPWRFFRHEQIRKSDHLLGILAGFVKNDKIYAFFQSKSNIILKTVDDEGENLFYHPVNRVSFIPGNVFNEMYYPIVVGTGDKKLPAYYIDATQLHAAHVYVIEARKNGLESPMKHNIYIPSNCKAMNPVKIREDQESFSFLCYEGENIYMKYIPLL